MMNLYPYLAVAIGGSLGAMSRHFVTITAVNLWGMGFPLGTLIVNTLGSFIAGFFLVFIIERYQSLEYLSLFIFTGFLGAFTTFSSFSAESLFFFEQSQWTKFTMNILANNIGALIMY